MDNNDFLDVDPVSAEWCNSSYCTTLFCGPYSYYRKCVDPVNGQVTSFCNCPSYSNGTPPAL